MDPYASELPVNRALPFWLDIKPGDEIANYTLAWAQEAGGWATPTQTRYGCGYVYSDEFRTPEEAKLEVERILGREIEVRGDIRFQSAVSRTPGSATGSRSGVIEFLEPLESTRSTARSCR